MRNLIKISFIILMTFAGILPQVAQAASDESYTVPLNPDNKGDEPTEPDPYRNRMPSRPVMFIISPDGIVSSLNPADIVAYELWDEADCCVVSVADETSFIEAVYSLEGSYILRIHIADTVYAGYLDL